MAQKVPLCPVCNASPQKKPKKKSKKKAKGGWNSDDNDESDEPAYPPGIMKVRNFFNAADRKVTDNFSRISLSLERN
jgi:NAD-dependent histone deacetylase SIR2